MRNALTIMKRELLAYYCSPLGTVVTVLFLLITGIAFTQNAEEAMKQPQMYPLIRAFLFWLYLVVVLAMPIITMRMFAEEKNTGTLEVLMTTAVTDVEVVLGKYFAALVFYIWLIAPTMAYVFVLRAMGTERVPLDTGSILAGYTGILLVGMLLLAIGFLCSSLTKSQVIAAIICFVISFGGFFLVPIFSDPPLGQRGLFFFFSPLHHIFAEFSMGLIDLRRVVFYVTATAWILFLTKKVIEARKWK